MTRMAVTRTERKRESRAPRVRMPVRKSRGGGSVLGLRLFDRLFERTRRGAAARAARTTGKKKDQSLSSSADRARRVDSSLYIRVSIYEFLYTRYSYIHTYTPDRASLISRLIA